MDPASIAALIQGGTALYNTFGKNNPARAAGNALGKIEGYGRDAYNPFIEQGQSAIQQLSPQYSQMAANPTDFYNDIISRYEPSKGFQYRQNKLNQLGHNTAAAGGFAGTEGDIQNRAEMFNGLLGEDMQQFLQNILGIQGIGQHGLEGSVGRGFQASSQLADYLGSAAGQQAGFDVLGQHRQNVGRNTGLSALANLIGGGETPSFSGMFGSKSLPQGSTMSLNKLNYMSPVSPVAARSGLFQGGV